MAGIKQRTKRGITYHVVRHQVGGKRSEDWYRCTHKTPEQCQRCTGMAEAKRRAADLEAGIPPEITPGSVTIANLWELWWTNHVAVRGKKSTLTFYKSQKQRIMLIGDHVVDSMTPVHVNDWIALLTAMGHPPARINRSLRTLKTMLRRGVQLGFTHNHPAQFTQKLKEPPPLRGPQMHQPATVAQLVAHAELLRDATIIRVAAGSGARVSEVLALEPKHVNIAKRGFGKLTLEQQAERSTRRIISTKGYERRTVPLLDDAADALAAWLPKRPKGSRFVFPGPDGGPLSYYTWEKRWSRIRRDAGLSEITFHELRDTYATVMIDAGAKEAHLKTWMAHSTVETTYKHYAARIEGSDDEIQAVANKRQRARAAKK